MKRYLKPVSILLFAGTCIVYSILLYEKHKLSEFVKLIEKDPYYVTDSLAGHYHSPNYKLNYVWEEHPNHQFEKQTNNFGFVKTNATLEKKDSNMFRILVTGDSHLDGVINNHESFPSLLEKHLNSKFPTIKTEVLNGGVGFYSFVNYAGMYKKFKFLKPDVFIVSVYSGNDFIEAILYDPGNKKIIPALQTFWYRLAKLAFQIKTNMASTQSTNQLLFFKLFPAKEDIALTIAKKHLQEINQQCLQNNTKLLVVFLPTKIDAEKKFRQNLKTESGWNDTVLNTTKNLTTSLSNWLKKQNISSINTVPDLSDNQLKLFYDTDQHLNVNGHFMLENNVFKHCNWENMYIKSLPALKKNAETEPNTAK